MDGSLPIPKILDERWPKITQLWIANETDLFFRNGIPLVVVISNIKHLSSPINVCQTPWQWKVGHIKLSSSINMFDKLNSYFLIQTYLNCTSWHKCSISEILRHLNEYFIWQIINIIISNYWYFFAILPKNNWTQEGLQQGCHDNKK